MPIALLPALLMGGIAAGGSLAGAALSSNAAGKAASTQASAAEQAQQLQATEAQNALDFQKQEFATNQQNMQPWLQAGQGALGKLTNLQPFQAPTGATEQNDPGYQFRLQQGQQALDNSAAAKGSLLSGNTLEAQQQYGQNYASNEYGNVYNRAFGQYQQNYNQLAGLAGTGQTAATNLGQQGQQAAQNMGNISMTSGAQQGQDLNNAAAATASGYVGSANAWGGALGNSTGNLSQMMLLSQLLGQQGNPATSPLGTFGGA